MILGFSRAKQGLCHTKYWGAGGIILWALLTVFLVLFNFFWSPSLIFSPTFFQYFLPSFFVYMRWDVKWFPLVTDNNPSYHPKNRFTGFRLRVGSWRPPGKHHYFKTSHRRRYMAEILPIRPYKSNLGRWKNQRRQILLFDNMKYVFPIFMKKWL